ncbi:MAG: exosortase-associated EpsI family protein [Lentisphaeria bacterium]|nr:exosortase-associated EpsI family protein [Lentisphaeria bacterium]
MIKIFLMLCSLIPLCLQIPYLLSAWRSSRLDQWDWIFYLLAVPAVVLAVRRRKMEQWDYHALVPGIGTLFLVLTTPYHKINALAAASAVVFIFAIVWGTSSWNFACRLLPAVMIVLLGTPSSSYALSLLLMCPVWMAWTIKFLLTGLCFVWIFCNERFNLQIKKGTLCFVTAVLCSSFLLLHSKEIYFEGRSFIPVFPGHIGEFWGRSIEPDQNTKRFFVTSTVKQFRYTKNNVDISVLAVKCGSNIHEIHPASHCLRTSFWTIHSEKTLYLQENFAVTEIDAQKGASRYLIWVWYSSEKFSTPGFLGFRRHFRGGGRSYTYQISTPVFKDIHKSRTELRKFIRFLKQDSRTGNRENRKNDPL